MTNTTPSNDPLLAALEDVLDVYGSDSARWPEPQRQPLLSLLGSSEAARQRHREAKALDAFLTSEGPANTDRAALLSTRILDAARREQAGAAPVQTAIIPLPKRERFTVVDGGKAVTTLQPRPAPNWISWTTAAALAASLVLGLAVGTQSSFTTGVFETQAATETDAGEYAFGDITSVEEDLI